MNSGAALERFKGIYSSVSESMNYIYQIVGFMDFDSEYVATTQVGANGQGPQSLDAIANEFNTMINQANSNSPKH